MKIVSLALLDVCLLLAIIFEVVGGSFTEQKFWLSFLPSLLANIATLAVAVLVIDNLYARQRSSMLGQANVSQSQFLFFLSNRLAFSLLEYLGLATFDESRNDPDLNFAFAHSRLKDIDLAERFYTKLMETKNKQDFVDGFEKILSRETGPISKALDTIYPRPDSTLKQKISHMSYSIGNLGALTTMLSSVERVNAQVKKEEQLTSERVNLLIKIAYQSTRVELETTQNAIVQLSDKAKANKLFMEL